MTIDHTLQRLQQFFQSKGWSAHRVAVEAGLSYPVVHRIYRPDFSPTVKTIRRLEALIPEDWHPVVGTEVTQLTPADPIMFDGSNIIQVKQETGQ